MKQFMLLMAVVGLAATGCANNRVLGRLARSGGTDTQVVRQRSAPRPNAIKSFLTKGNLNADSDLELASYRGGACCAESCCDDTCCGGCDDTCCGECTNDACCGCGNDCCGGCCDSSCCDGGCCGDDECCVGGDSGGSCSSCGGRGCGLCQRMNPHAGGYPEAYNFNPSPPTGQVAYPYYTVRGPRDFLRNNPPSIGPY